MALAELSRPPIPVLVLVGTALVVVILLLAQFAINFILGLVQLALIGVAFVAIGAIAFYLWRRGDIRRP